MKRFCYVPSLLLAACVLLTSCLKNEEQEVTLYNDAAITSFVLGTLNYKHPTTGAETTLSGSIYPMAIDQLRDSIYNRNELPAGVDLTKVPCTINTYRGSAVAIKNLTDDKFSWYDYSTPIDFSQTRTFRVLSSDGSFYRDYHVTLNTKQAYAANYWTEKSDTTLFAGMTNMRILAPDTLLVIMGQKENATYIYTSKDKGDTWTQENTVMDADAWQNAVCANGQVVVLNGGQLMSSANLQQWNSTANSWNLKQLLVAGTKQLFAVTDNYTLKAAALDQLDQWDDEQTDPSLTQDSVAHLLELTAVAGVVFPHTGMSNTDYVLVAGQRNGQTVVWRKISPYGNKAQKGMWVNIPAEDINNYLLPAQDRLSLIYKDNTVLAVGNDTTAYQSPDQGISWRKATLYTLPTAMQTVTIDNKGVMWGVSVDGERGKVWRGYDF